MAADEALLFIDANQYLDLYRTHGGRQTVAAVNEQHEHIFVTAQVVSEVKRNKVQVATEFINGQLANLKLNSLDVPPHLFPEDKGAVGTLRGRVSELQKSVKELRTDVEKIFRVLLRDVCHSADEVSRKLAPLFGRAVEATDDELQRARDRRERGNPPGKRDDPLGDQISWEQILTASRAKRRIWVVTRDADFVTTYAREQFLNAALHEELQRASLQGSIEVRCFDTIIEGLTDFASTTKVKAKDLPKGKVADKIREEQESFRSQFGIGKSDLSRLITLLEFRQSLADAMEKAKHGDPRDADNQVRILANAVKEAERLLSTKSDATSRPSLEAME